MKITILYDGDEDREKAACEARGETLVLVSEEIEQGLRAAGHDVRRVASAPDPLEFARQIAEDGGDLIFNNCESFAGRGSQEQNVAGLLELFGRRFTGSGAIGLSLAGDKGLTKTLLGFEGIVTPKFAVMQDGQLDHIDDFNFPMIVKPANADSSIGIDEGSVVKDVKGLLERISWIERELNAPALIEEFIDGREIYVGVLGGDKPEALPVLEWDLSGLPGDGPKIATQGAKFDTSNPAYQNPLRVPDDLPEAVLSHLAEQAVQAFRAVRLRDYGRVDMRLRQRRNGAPEDAGAWESFLIEVNPNPHLSRDSELAIGCAKKGLSYEDLLERIVQNALGRPA